MTDRLRDAWGRVRWGSRREAAAPRSEPADRPQDFGRELEPGPRRPLREQPGMLG